MSRSRHQGVRSLVFIVVLAVASVAWVTVAGHRPLLGLDLQGGVSVILAPTEEASSDSLDQAVAIIRQRVDGLGVAEPEITRQGDTIVVQIPGVDDTERALELVGQTAELRFRPVLSVVEEAQLQAIAGASPTTVVPGATTTTSSSGDATTTTTAGSDSSTTTAPGGATTTIDAPSATDEVGFALVEGELAAAQVASTTVPPTTTAPGATTPPTTTTTTTTTAAAGVPTTTAPDGAAPPTTVPPIDADAILAQYELTAPGADEAEATVVLGEYDDDNNLVRRYELGPAGLTGEALESASATLQGTEWTVLPIFRSGAEGIDAFNGLALQCNGQQPTCPTGQLAITLDSRVVSAPSVNAAQFTRDQVVISGSFDEREARDVALVLNYGALPLELEAQQSQIVSATLGSDALAAGLVAGVVGLLLAALYMILYYRLMGVVAVLSLTVSAGLLWALVCWLGETQGLALTLSGITGIIVSIGVSLDTNVVYYEHVKEDVQHGRTVRSALDRAFSPAFSTIVKANVASIIGAGLLYVLSVGSVRGFALFLGIATVLDLVAAWFFMRPMSMLIARSRLAQERPGILGVGRPREAS